MKKKLEVRQIETDVLIIGGDFTDLGTDEAYGSFKEIYDKVMGDGEEPVPVYLMGNHDYWLAPFVDSFEVATPAKMQKRFTKYTGEYPYSHKIINGYHFICWSSSDGSYDKSYSDKKWIRSELDKAIAADPTKPIFVISHLNPSDTAYGSDEWGNADIADVLKDYSQVISISGHSHYSLIDERSIWEALRHFKRRVSIILSLRAVNLTAVFPLMHTETQWPINSPAVCIWKFTATRLQ